MSIVEGWTEGMNGTCLAWIYEREEEDGRAARGLNALRQVTQSVEGIIPLYQVLLLSFPRLSAVFTFAVGFGT